MTNTHLGSFYQFFTRPSSTCHSSPGEEIGLDPEVKRIRSLVDAQRMVLKVIQRPYLGLWGKKSAVIGDVWSGYRRGAGRSICPSHILRKGNKLRLIRGWGATRGDPPEAASPYSPPFLSPGGIGEAVASALVGEPGVTVTRLAVSQVPRSGKPAELLKMFGIDRDAIAQAVRGLVTRA